MKEIKMTTTVAELLNNYDGMKDILIDINPKFKKLNNPVLRRTLAKVATVKQAAIVGGMEPLDLLNKLRVAVGQEPLNSDGTSAEIRGQEENIPDWIEKSPAIEIDANRLLDEEKNPLAETNTALKKIDSGDIIAIKSDFKPEPLIEEFEKKGLDVYCKELGENSFVTYIKKS